MVEMNAVAVTQIRVLVIQTIVQVLLNNHTHTTQDPLLDDQGRRNDFYLRGARLIRKIRFG